MHPDDVRNARQSLGLTQSEFASLLELEGKYGKDTVRSWESGKRPISGPARVAIRLLLERGGFAPSGQSAILEPRLAAPNRA
jgi:DNA-binding transcriptional regulator YiaG